MNNQKGLGRFRIAWILMCSLVIGLYGWFIYTLHIYDLSVKEFPAGSWALLLVLIFSGFGGLLGSAQWFLLRTVIPVSLMWVVAAVAGWGGASLIFFFLGPNQLFLLILYVILSGVIAGVWQSKILSEYMPNSKKWLKAHFGGIAAMAASILPLFVLFIMAFGGVGSEAMALILLVAFFALLILAYPLVTGMAMTRLLREKKVSKFIRS